MTVVGLGEVLWDIYEDEKYIGGAPANFACDIAQLGYKAVLVSRVGKDRLGEELLSALKLRGIKTGYIQRDDIKATGRVLIKLKKGAVPSFTCIRDVAFDYIETLPINEKLAKITEVILFGNLAQRNMVSRTSIYKFLDASPARIKILDFNHKARKLPDKEMVTESLKRATFVKTDKREWRLLKKVLDKSEVTNQEVFQYIADHFGVDIVCVSLGRGGCVISTGKINHYSPGIKIKPVDTVGAGDAFLAGFVDASLQHKALAETARWANALGAFVASMNSASPQFSRDDILRFLEKHTKRVSIAKYRNLEF